VRTVALRGPHRWPPPLRGSRPCSRGGGGAAAAMQESSPSCVHCEQVLVCTISFMSQMNQRCTVTLKTDVLLQSPVAKVLSQPGQLWPEAGTSLFNTPSITVITNVCFFRANWRACYHACVTTLRNIKLVLTFDSSASANANCAPQHLQEYDRPSRYSMKILPMATQRLCCSVSVGCSLAVSEKHSACV
jgi:hypothetical protein